ncbi:MAG: undecaprenyldiphospho-muramoylpentapeptide beta-N-acetylglucosaminyltransferase [Endomicrobiales bacterium]|nr:undecaprenyldiphospho-muramoylpentapeptide beta-N-acetylglucosaminyltransferase [Endomicrobiales bacterium]
MPQESRIIIAAGGTGGHVYPGIALAEELKSRGHRPFFVVKKGDLARDMLSRRGLEYAEISSMGLPRSPGARLIRFPFVLAAGLVSARRILKEIRPSACVGMGSYISFPVVVNAKSLGIPVLIHEQNAVAGLANGILSRFASKVAVSFKPGLKNLGGMNPVLTGNPVRKDIFGIDSARSFSRLGLEERRFTILVFGGSQGAARLNSTVVEAWKNLQDIGSGLQFIHIAGPADFENTEREFARQRMPGRAFPYIHDMGEAYSCADIIISRSGATTVAELRHVNKPSILIPFPHATGNHQYFNAKSLESDGKAVVITEKNLDAGVLSSAIRREFSNRRPRAKRVEPPAVFPQEKLAEEILNLIGSDRTGK